MTYSCRIPLTLVAGLVVSTVRQVYPHPGGFSDGRASCGTEYHTAETAFDIVDVNEAWFVRRILTCENPFFWLSFATKEELQKVYIGVNAPEIARFNDKVQFNGVVFGPGLETDLSDVSVPSNLRIPTAYSSSTLRARVLKPPRTYANCDFVTNQVMKQYCEVKDGRCTEVMTLDNDYKDPLIAGLEYSAQWLYSFDHKMSDVGRYWLLTWLTDRETGEVATGKIDVTVGPWIWYRYATDSTLKKVQSQGSSCQCGFNALEWREENLQRLSNMPAKSLQKALPRKTCESNVGKSPCIAAKAKDPLSSDTEIEWSGKFELTPGSTYSWNFHAGIGCTAASPSSKQTCKTTLPDPAIEVLIVSESAITAVAKDVGSNIEAVADSTMKAQPVRVVEHDGSIDLGLSESSTTIPKKSSLRMQNIPAGSSSPLVTVFKVTLPSDAPKKWWVFTQHVPQEFSANFLVCASGACKTSSSTYIFPFETSLYLGASKYEREWEDTLETEVRGDGLQLLPAKVACLITLLMSALCLV